MTAADYAKALYELGDKADMSRVRQALERRRHARLLPRIFSEYQKLQVAHERLEKHKTVTPEKDRTRTLLELYRKLVASAH